MFGSCVPSQSGQHLDEGDQPRRPKRYEGQRRELVVRRAEQVPRRMFIADIDEIEEGLSEEEREYEATAAIREEERRRKEEEMKKAAVQKAVSGASGQLSGSLFDRIQGLAKLQEVAKLALNLEVKQLPTAEKISDKQTSASGKAPDKLKMPVPEAPMVVVKVTHPCTVSLLRSKLSRALNMSLEDVRVVHRNKVLTDEGFVPDDTVDLGEQDAAEEEDLDLSFLWIVDASVLRATSPTSSSSAKGPKCEATKTKIVQKRQGTTTEAQENAGSNYSNGESGNDSERGDREEGGAVATKARGSMLGPTSDYNTSGASTAPDKHQNPESDGDNKTGVGRINTAKNQINKTGCELYASVPKLSFEGDAEIASGTAGKEEGVSAPEKTKKRKWRIVPGSLVLTSVSASNLPDTEKGVFSKQDPYLVVKWAEQEARTTVKRDAGSGCTWPNEELVLLVRNKKHLQKSVEVEVWNDNAGDKKPRPDVLIGKGVLTVKHLAHALPATRSNGKEAWKEQRGDGDANKNLGGEGVVLTVNLVPGDERRLPKRKTAGAVTLTLSYTPPRRKAPKVDKQEVAAAETMAIGGDATTMTDTEDDTFSSIASLSAWSSQGPRNRLSSQELGAVISEKLEGFDIRKEVSKINCLRYAQSLINEGFGQRGAFANIQEEHMAGYPMFIPRAPRKRLLALSELIRLQMKAEKDKFTTAMETIKDQAALEERYTVDGNKFFDTIAAMNTYLEDKRTKAGLVEGRTPIKDEDLPPQPKPPKPRTAAKEKVIRAIEAAADAEGRGIFRSYTNLKHRGRYTGWHDAESGGGGEMCCEKHAFQIERSAVRMVEERVKETSYKVDMWLDQADRFKNGAIPRKAVKTVVRDALLLNGLPSPRESDVTIFLEHASLGDEGLQFDRGKLELELEKLVRREMCLKSGVPLAPSEGGT